MSKTCSTVAWHCLPSTGPAAQTRRPGQLSESTNEVLISVSNCRLSIKDEDKVLPSSWEQESSNKTQIVPVLVPKFEVTSRIRHRLTHSLTVERIRWRKHSKVLAASLVPAASKSTKHSPESLSISSLGYHRRYRRIHPPFRYFYEKTLAKNHSSAKYFNGGPHALDSYVTSRM